MATKTFTLVDTSRNLYQSASQIGAEEVGGKADGYSIRATTLRGGLQEGVETIEVDNGTFRFTVIPTRGMGVWKGWLGDLEIGWKSPVRGPVHPRFVPISEPSGLGWLDGFDELLVRCGLTSNGAPEFDAKTGRLIYPLHGRIANKPAHFVEVVVDDESGEISVTGVVDETRFHFEKLRLKSTIKSRPGEKGFRIIDEVTNLSAAPGEMQLLYHVNFGRPLLDVGAQVVAPVKTTVPCDLRAAEGIKSWDRYPVEQVNYVEQCYFFELLADSAGNTQVLLKNGHSTQAVGLRFPVKQLPCFTLWKDTAAAQDGYVTGLEPATNFPNPRSFEKEQGRVVALAPAETRRFELALEVYPDANSVRAAEQQVAKLQGGVSPQIFETPQKGWRPT